MRTFIALNLPKKERQRIHRSVQLLREEGLPVRWVDPDALHLTLKFLGEVRPEKLARIEATLAEVAASTPPLVITLGGFGAFPTLRRPRVIWLGVEAAPELRGLKQDLEWALTDLGFEAETRAFHPHLTLGRAEPGDGGGAFRSLDELVPGLECSGEVQLNTVDLMRSQLSQDGAHYAVLSRAKFVGA
ncbi:MAG: RNA 2',3'-cyclic phosphodiesterase [Longimicrobiales bacterium]|nr:RNA 2',3'-cyclic phosphodiesterase [Longimicrobiales bacterium]